MKEIDTEMSVKKMINRKMMKYSELNSVNTKEIDCLHTLKKTLATHMTILPKIKVD